MTLGSAIDHEYRRRGGFGFTLADAICSITGHRGICEEEIDELLFRFVGDDYLSVNDEMAWYNRRYMRDGITEFLGGRWVPTCDPVYYGHRGRYFVIRDVVRALPDSFKQWARSERRRCRRGITPWQEELCRRRKAEAEMETWMEVLEMAQQLKEFLRPLSRKDSPPKASRPQPSSAT